MGDLNLPAGINLLSYARTTALPLTGANKPSWFTSANFNAIFKQSANRSSYISCNPTSAFPAFSSLDAVALGQPLATYIFNLKQAITVDDSLFTVGGSLADTDAIYAGVYGASGNGTTDSTTAINQAIQVAKARLAATGAGTLNVVLPKGIVLIRASYLTTDTYQPQGIKLESNVQLVGRSRDSTTLYLGDSPAGATFTRSSMNVSPIDYNVSYSSNAQFFSAVNMIGCTNSAVRDLKITADLSKQANIIRYSGNGQTNTPSPYLMAYDEQNYGNVATHAILAKGGSNNLISNVWAENMAGFCVKVWDSPGTITQNSILKTAVNGAYTTYGNSAGATLIGCECYDTYSDPVRLHSTQSIVRLNKVYSPRYNNLSPSIPDFGAIYIEDGTTPEAGMPARGTGNMCVVEDNVVYDAPAHGIDINGPNNIIRYNHVYRCGGCGVQAAQQNLTIRFNTLEDNGLDLRGNSYKPGDGLLWNNGVTAYKNQFNGTISDNIFRNTVGKQDYAIRSANGQPILGATIERNHATGQVFIGQFGTGTSLADNYPANVNTTGTTASPRAASAAASQPLVLANPFDWDVSTKPNATLSITNAVTGILYPNLLGLNASVVGVLTITNNDTSVREFDIPSTSNHYAYSRAGVQSSKQVILNAGATASIQVQLDGGSVNWFVDFSNSGGAGATPAGIVAPATFDETDMQVTLSPLLYPADTTAEAFYPQASADGITYSNGHSAESTKGGASISIGPWYGRGIALAYLTRPDAGMVSVLVDGQVVDSFDASAVFATNGGVYTLATYTKDLGAVGQHQSLRFVNNTAGKYFRVDTISVF